MDKIKDSILKKIEQFDQIPVFSDDIQKLTEARYSDENELMALLKYEIPVVTNILKLANSSMYEVDRKYGSLEELLNDLGFEELKKLLTMSLTTNIYAKGSGYEIGKGEMRRHSIASAIISKYLKPFLPDVALSRDLFTCCLIADIGKLVLSEEISTANYKINQLLKNEEIDFLTTEKRVIGITHPEIGARILNNWEFPPEIIQAVRYHHEPNLVENAPLTHFVSLSDTIAMLAGFATGIDALEYRAFPDLFKKYGIKQKDIEVILMESINEIKEIIPYNPA